MRSVDARWYLFDAQAAIVYGVARLTADVDVTVRPTTEATPVALVQACERHGFSRRFVAPLFLERSRVLPLRHDVTELPVDIVLAALGLEDEFLDRAAIHSIDGVEVPVADLSDLVIMKTLAGRPKDVDDIVMLLRVQGPRVDMARVTNVLRLLEDALGQSDLMPLLEQARTRSGV
jgi:Nucleotidyltransferase of unknown function (DUF6036)